MDVAIELTGMYSQCVLNVMSIYIVVRSQKGDIMSIPTRKIKAENLNFSDLDKGKHILSIRHDGLGGRLVCLLHALSLARYLDSRLSIVWEDNEHCSCPFEDLFIPNSNLTIHTNLNDSIEAGTRNLGYIGKHRNIICQTMDDVDHIFVNDCKLQRRLTRIERQRELLHILQASEVILMRSTKRFPFNTGIEPSAAFVTNIKLLPIINQQINIFVNRHAINHTLGIHVREGDPQKEVQPPRIAPLQSYLDEASKLMSSARYKNIFVSAQTEETVSIFQQKFRQYKVIFYPISDYTRSKTGIRQALVDLIILSHCDTILGVKSRFNIAAALIGKKTLIKLNSK
jgi:hypothetical protein